MDERLVSRARFDQALERIVTTGLFVYGTLQPGKKNAHVLEAIGGDFVEATVRGRLTHQGWGAHLGFPALILDDDGEEVGGFLFRSTALEAAWLELDQFEGTGYQRVIANVSIVTGESVQAFVYELRRSR